MQRRTVSDTVSRPSTVHTHTQNKLLGTQALVQAPFPPCQSLSLAYLGTSAEDDKFRHETQLNSTPSLMRKDLTGHTGPNGHLHMPIIKLKNDKQNKHAKFMVTLPHGRQQHYLAVF